MLPVQAGAAELYRTQSNVMAEIVLTAKQDHNDPFNDVTLDVIFTDPHGKEFPVPAFWAGGAVWKVRYASPTVGTHAYRSVCSNEAESGLHGVKGSVEVRAYEGQNPLYRRGPLRVAQDKRHLEHADGTPFFWLGDTWWMGLSKRLGWPEDFKKLAADRKAKGFNVIQIVAGLPPDSHPFDPRSVNEEGFPWTEGYTQIRPEYFDAADRRLLYLVEEGFTPCIFGAWGYHIRFMGVERAQQHWRYLIARYGALPVVWCTAGEANLSWYLAEGFPYDDRPQVKQWTQVTRYIHETDPFNRLVTVHPTGLGWSARHAIDDVSLLDFDMLQTPHGEREAVPVTLSVMRQSYAATPVMPVINGEPAYEGLMGRIPAKWPRRMFWICMMNGAAGHTYGANGIWQVNRPGDPHGPSPHMESATGYGATPWNEAMKLPGSQQVAMGKKFLERYPWHEFAPHPEWVRYAPSAGSLSLDDAQWIWFPEGNPAQNAPTGKRYLRKQFEIPAGKKVVSATVLATADDVLSLRVNGADSGSSSGWAELRQFDVAGRVRAGINVLAVEVENVFSDVPANPAGFIGAMEIRFADGQTLRIVSDASWRSSKTGSAGWDQPGFDDTSWSQATAMGAHGAGPWGRLTGTTNDAPHAAGTADVRVVYVPHPDPVEIVGLDAETSYTALYFDPVSGEESPIGQIRSDSNGVWACSPPRDVKEEDWVVVLQTLGTSE